MTPEEATRRFERSAAEIASGIEAIKARRDAYRTALERIAFHTHHSLNGSAQARRQYNLLDTMREINRIAKEALK